MIKIDDNFDHKKIGNIFNNGYFHEKHTLNRFVKDILIISDIL